MRLRLTKRLARTRSDRLIDGHLVRLPASFILPCPFYDGCALRGVIFDNTVLLFCYRTSCPFLDQSDTIPVLWQWPDTASKRALVRAPLRALMVIEILGVPGLSTLVHLGD
jgi:hypothetical protein